MYRLLALIIALALAVPLSIAIERSTEAPSAVGSGLAGLFAIILYDMAKRWLDQR